MKSHDKNKTEFNGRNYKKLDVQVPFSGYWLSVNYLNNIQKYKSPLRAQFASKSEFDLITIADRTLKPDTVLYNFHESGEFYTILKNKNVFELWKVKDYTDSLEKKINSIQVISPLRIKIGQQEFAKINPSIKRDFPNSGLKDEILVLESILFNGIYTTSEGKQVEFKSNGEVSGLDGYYNYHPIIDYYDQGLNVDQVLLIKTKKNAAFKHLENYGFKFKGDTLNLYKLNCIDFDVTSKNCAEVEFGDLIYQMRRKK